MSRHRRLASGIGGSALLFAWLAFFRASETETAGRWQESHSLLGDGQAISALAFSPDNHRVAAGDFEGNLFLWELPSGKRLARFRAHKMRIPSLAFSPDGQILTTAGSDDSVKLWSVSGRPPTRPSAEIGEVRVGDPEAPEEIHTLLGHQACVVAMAFAPDGKTLITGSADGIVKLWNTATGREHASWQTHEGLVNLACSPDGQTLATAGLDRTVKLWNLATGPLTFPGGEGRARGLRELVSFSEPFAVYALLFSEDGKSLVTANREGTIRFWDIASHQATETLSAPGGIILSLAITGDGRRLLSASLEGVMNLWNLDSGRAPARLDLGGQLVRAVAFSPGGGQFAFAAVSTIFPQAGEDRGARPDQRDFAVKIWEPLSSQESEASSQGQDAAKSNWHPDCQPADSQAAPNRILLWKIEGQMIRLGICPVQGGLTIRNRKAKWSACWDAGTRSLAPCGPPRQPAFCSGGGALVLP